MRVAAACHYFPQIGATMAFGSETATSRFIFMLDDTLAQLHRKAEECRRLAETSENVEREALWLDRADYWEELAQEAEKLRPKKQNLAPICSAGCPQT
jgi:hypothetical protein